jgi:hypothetical protein
VGIFFFFFFAISVSSGGRGQQVTADDTSYREPIAPVAQRSGPEDFDSWGSSTGFCASAIGQRALMIHEPWGLACSTGQLLEGARIIALLLH